MGLKQEWVGRRFGAWTVIEYLRGAKALCRCDCGVEATVWRSNLGKGSNGCATCGSQKSGDKRKRPRPPKSPKPKVSRRKEWVGRVFGQWTVIADDGPLGGPRYVKCRCSCGTEDLVRLSNLVQKQSLKCRPCVGKVMRPVRDDLDLDATGEVFGKRTIVADDSKDRRSTRYVAVQCECGKRAMVKYATLLIGHANQCRVCASRVHGMTHTDVYWIHCGMLQRCNNPKNEAYAHYGGRGIRVAPEWMGRGGMKRFSDHIGPRPSAAHSIDRMDVNGNYEPGNVRWATFDEQASNKRPRRVVPRELSAREFWTIVCAFAAEDGHEIPDAILALTTTSD